MKAETMRSSGAGALILLAVALAALIAAGLVSGPPQALGDSRLLPLDSGYAGLAYGRSLAAGQGLVFGPGEAAAPFHADPLFTGLLALAYRYGVGEAALPGLLLTLGRLLFAINAVILADLTRRIAAPLLREGPVPAEAAGLIGGMLFALNGWAAFHHMAGTDSGLLTLLLLGAIWAVAADIPWLAVAISLLAALTRIEMLTLLLALPAAWRKGPRGWRALSLPLIAGAALLGAALWAGNFENLRPLPLSEFGQQALKLLFFVFNGLGAPGYGQAFTLPLALVAAGAGWWFSRQSGHDGETADTTTLLLTLSLIGALIIATQPDPAFERYRSLAPFYPALIALAALGLAGLARWLAGSQGGAQALAAPALLIALLTGAQGWYTVAAFQLAYDEELTRSAERAELAAWIEEQAAPDALIAGQVPGLIRWMTDHSVLDLSGRAAPTLAASVRGGPGALYEALVEARPDYVAYDSRLDSFLLPGAALAENAPEPEAINPARVALISPDWSSAEQAAAALEPFSTVWDRLNVASLSSEAEHNYQAEGLESPATLLTLPLSQAGGENISDGLRVGLQAERFTIGVAARQPLILAGRFLIEQNTSLRVLIEGREIGAWRFAAAPGLWQERLFTINSGDVPADQIEVELISEGGVPYSPAQYWSYVAMIPTPPSPQIEVMADFAGQMRLYGVDLDLSQAQPGGQVGMSMQWIALAPPADGSNPLRLFLHLVEASTADDPASLRAQLDIEPGGPLRPFWTWQIEEMGVDALTLPLPADLPPGDYLLLAGLYTLNDGQRLPITAGEDFGSARVLITEIEVR